MSRLLRMCAAVNFSLAMMVVVAPALLRVPLTAFDTTAATANVVVGILCAGCAWMTDQGMR